MIITDDKGDILAALDVHVGWNPVERTVIFTGFSKNDRSLRISFERTEMEGMMAGLAVALYELQSPYVAAKVTATLTPQSGEEHGAGPLCEDPGCIAAGTPHGHTCPSCGHGTFHPAPEGAPTL
jgi:hypothetical protein